MQTTIKTVLQNFVVFPILATNFLFSPFGATGSFQLALLTPNINQAPVSEATVNQQLKRQEQAKKIDAYFAKYGMPLEGHGIRFVTEAEYNEIDPYLAAAIAVRESTGGKFGCKRFAENAWGWNSCRAGLGGSTESAIALISAHLGGNRESTRHYYDGKTTVQILKTYNPDSIIPGYSSQVVRIMETMADMDINPEIAMNS